MPRTADRAATRVIERRIMQIPSLDYRAAAAAACPLPTVAGLPPNRGSAAVRLGSVGIEEGYESKARSCFRIFSERWDCIDGGGVVANTDATRPNGRAPIAPVATKRISNRTRRGALPDTGS